MSNLSSSSASGKRVNFQRGSQSNDGSASTWEADCSDIQSGGAAKGSFKILFRNSLFTVLLLAVHWSSGNGPQSQWRGDAPSEAKAPRNKRILYNNSASYMSSDYNPSTQSTPGVRENNEQRRNGNRRGSSQYNSPPPPTQSSSSFASSFTTPFTSPFTAPFGSDDSSPSSGSSPSLSSFTSPLTSLFSSSPLSSPFTSPFSSSSSSAPFTTPINSANVMNNGPPRNNNIWRSYEDGLRYLNDRAFRNMGNDFRYPNSMDSSFSQQNNLGNALYTKLNDNALFYLFSFIAGLFLLSQVGPERLLMLASAVGIAYHVRKSITSS
ncbi:Plasmodium exported protein, unknown function [Plasmodium vivax]|uniref:(malaria parasite P. vivax) hypothetical protein n=1 Tax=Plasmodium vivax TaxID=5855 RepID=A0A1G4H6S8_PLAVI|nr:unnamed protein product [Plasmodium vivax]CAI7717866.1 Plasmodium exported protein, unknown function [Plasmodium vivax]SCO70566.1 Plasmodium exported protein, unknown function [Plasmodium vivax]